MFLVFVITVDASPNVAMLHVFRRFFLFKVIKLYYDKTYVFLIRLHAN